MFQIYTYKICTKILANPPTQLTKDDDLNSMNEYFHPNLPGWCAFTEYISNEKGYLMHTQEYSCMVPRTNQWLRQSVVDAVDIDEIFDLHFEGALGDINFSWSPRTTIVSNILTDRQSADYTETKENMCPEYYESHMKDRICSIIYNNRMKLKVTYILLPNCIRDIVLSYLLIYHENRVD